MQKVLRSHRRGDDFDDIRAEYTAILQKQLASGNSGIVKTKYLTFTIDADSLKTARSRLTRIGLDLLGYFKTMGCVAHVMDGQERLEVLHGIFHPDGEPFRFDWDWLAPSGLSTKDFVAPSSLCFGTAKAIRSGIRHHKMKPYKAVEKAERQLMSANAEYFYQKSLRDNPQIAQAASNPISRMWQKRRIKQQYAKAARQAGQAAAQGAAATAENGFRVTKLATEGGERVAEFAARNWKTILIVAVFGLLALLLITGLQSCTVMAGTAGTGVTASSYFSKDKDMLGAEKAYAKLEQKLQRYLDTYEATHNYDEYHFYLDEIEHDPYVLISILSALHDGVFTLAEVQGELEMLFEKQYILIETVTMQIRYRTKMMVIIGPYGVPQVITYQEPYEYYICTVKLKNKDLSHLPVEVLTEEQLSAYSLYMRTLGNRPDLFGKAQYPNASTIKQPTYYDIPPEALKDDRFTAMMEEATKYIGYPYVWGGSSPSTSFDCSGYISWVLNHSGWTVGRQTAQGLYNFCTPVSAAQIKPGDLVFFKGTYDTPGVSHCGIYVGNSIMLHCGDPISYTNLNSKYWQEHFYSYGRLP